MTDYLFDTPWWLLTLFFAIGALFAWMGFARGERDKLLGGIGIVLLLAGATLFTLSKLVETDREQVVRRCNELFSSVEHKDWSALESHLTPDATVSLSKGVVFCSNRDEIIKKATYYTKLGGLLSLNVTRLEAKADSAGFTTEASVYVNAEKGTDLTVWQFSWRKTGEVWSVYKMEALQIGVQPGK